VSKSNDSRFWIVTPSYNQGRFIEQTIESVLSQPVENIEYWVIDGKSTDQTVSLLKSYRNRVAWLSEKDNGQTDALNKGLERLLKSAQSKDLDPQQVFVAYINSDDYYLPTIFPVVAQAFAANPQAQWLVGDCLIVNERGDRIQALIQTYKTWCRRLGIHRTLAVLNPVPQPAVFFRLSALQEVGLFNSELRYVMDYEYWWRLLSQVGQPILVATPLAAFRIHGASKGGSQYLKQFAEELTIAQRFVTNPLLLFLHRLHTLIIITIYRILK
jgi:glycosyltransferase involved in cell wall biosynthesis